MCVSSFCARRSNPTPSCHFISYNVSPPPPPPPPPPKNLMFLFHHWVGDLPFPFSSSHLCISADVSCVSGPAGTRELDRMWSLPLSSFQSCQGRQTHKQSIFLEFSSPKAWAPNPITSHPHRFSHSCLIWGGKHFCLCIWRLSIV